MINLAIEEAHRTLKNNSKGVVMKEAIKIIPGKRVGCKNLILLEDGRTVAVSVSPGSSANIRQFYEGTDELLTYSLKKSGWYRYRAEELTIADRPNRISPSDGSKAYDARAELTSRMEVA